MWLKWFPWKFTVSKLAQSHGFLDPISLLARVRRFSQPAEVSEPVELLRAGVVMHARGLINARAIQHNLDWIWPFWVERQFDPIDEAFIPRAFSLTHINLTHRNWTAIGVPDCDHIPIVDPAGLVTPRFDGWSIDAWILPEDGRLFAPSRMRYIMQELMQDAGPTVVTRTVLDDVRLESAARVDVENERAVCRISLTAKADGPAWLAFALRPYNPEGISFVHAIALDGARQTWSVEGDHAAHFDVPVERHYASEYRHGDAANILLKNDERTAVTCDVGMATAAALFRIPENEERRVTLSIPLDPEHFEKRLTFATAAEGWARETEGTCQLTLPHGHFQFLYDAALRTLILHSPEDVYAGPYTYKRFWFRDAAIILRSLLAAGMIERVERVIDRFPSRQSPLGYFHSQEGEWDSNGQVLWIMDEYCRATGKPPKDAWLGPIYSGAKWITRKRRAKGKHAKHPGLFPAGFSAEHLGPIDYYYWDDFWGVAGLYAAANMLRMAGQKRRAGRFDRDAAAFMADIDASLVKAAARLGRPAMPAAPDRRMDAGAIGSLSAGYPVPLVPPHDERLLDTAEYLMERCLVQGGFFQDMIHSGINAYLTLHLAQVLLRAGDERYAQLVQTVAEIASPTGQWPEAVHPRTKGGCMGDGHHVWAASEWLIMMRNCFALEEPFENRLVLGAGLKTEWLQAHETATLGPTPTRWGAITVRVTDGDDALRVEWDAAWHGAAPAIEVRLPGMRAVTPDPGQTSVTLSKERVA
jgi:hypothetical protein